LLNCGRKITGVGALEFMIESELRDFYVFKMTCRKRMGKRRGTDPPTKKLKHHTFIPTGF
jgi:hypothetical protein